MKLSIIVAAADNGVIGQNGRLPWRLPAELKHFKAITLGKPVLMGRRTWESIGRPLPGRRNLVISRRPGYEAAGAEVFASIEGALEAVAVEPEIMIIGGADLYRALLPRASRIHLTRVHAEVAGDAYFPAPDAAWRLVAEQRREADGEHLFAMTFQTWERNTP